MAETTNPLTNVIENDPTLKMFNKVIKFDTLNENIFIQVLTIAAPENMNMKMDVVITGFKFSNHGGEIGWTWSEYGHLFLSDVMKRTKTATPSDVLFAVALCAYRAETMISEIPEVFIPWLDGMHERFEKWENEMYTNQMSDASNIRDKKIEEAEMEHKKTVDKATETHKKYNQATRW